MEIYPTKILLIEDDEDDVILLKKLLSKVPNARYEIVWEGSYQQGLEQMLGGEYDLCMLDYMLGAQNGIDLVRDARLRGYAGPIILLTGAGEGEIDIQALQAGADDYISKTELQGTWLSRIIRYAIERKKAERERERLTREQIASRELENRRNEFISMVVHELKTPLTSLKGYAQLLQRRTKKSGDEQAVQLTIRMDGQIKKLTGLIEDFLDVTRISGGKLQFREEYFVFDEMVSEVIEELKLTSDKIIECQGRTNKTIWGDRLRIGQVITNLLTNAMKYAPQADRIIVHSSADDQSVTVSVQDFGPGIPEDQQAKIFNAFYRVEQHERSGTPGLGLGLHIAAEIIQRQEGQIWVESQPGVGSIFRFVLPVDRPHLPEEPAEAPPTMQLQQLAQDEVTS